MPHDEKRREDPADEIHRQHLHLTCTLCDTPEACSVGDVACSADGVYRGGPHVGQHADVIEAKRVTQRDDMQEFAPGPGGHDDDDPVTAALAKTEEVSLTIVWPTSTPELVEKHPLFAITCDQVLRFIIGPGELPSPETDARSAKLTDAAIAAYDLIQDAVQELRPDGKISSTGTFACSALVAAFALARQYQLSGIRTPEIRAMLGSMLGNYALALANPLGDQMMGLSDVEDGEGDQPPKLSTDPVALDLAQRMANSRR